MKRRPSIAIYVLLPFAVGMLVVCGSQWLGAQSSGQHVEFRRAGDKIDVIIGGHDFTTYHFDPQIAKPFFHPIRSARGTIITRDFPNGNEIPPEHLKDPSLEPHQRSMYFSHGSVDGIDYWGEEVFSKWSDDSVFGRKVLQKVEEMRAEGDSGVLRASFTLRSPRDRVIAEEDQAFVFRGDDRTRIIDCEFTLQANHGSAVTMGDTKEGTFAIRVAKELNSPPGHMVNSTGAEGEKQIWGKRADWVDYYGELNGEPVGVAVLESPKSFRHPTYWHARAYGLLAANPFGIREFTDHPQEDGSWTIPVGERLTFRYRVIIHQGDYKQAGIAEAYQRYAAQ
ncbi:MAG: PmoA family protein [Bryobacteraceae bacterium]